MMPILKIGQKTLKMGQKALKIGPINFISDAVLVIYDPDLCSEVIEEKKTNEKSVTKQEGPAHSRGTCIKSSQACFKLRES